MIGILGADAVGMSTVMEAVAAHWAGLRVCGVSLVTNAGAGLSGDAALHEEVLEAAAAAGPRLARVIGRFAADLAAERRVRLTAPDAGQSVGRSRPAARAAAFFSAQADSTLSLCGRMGQCSSRLRSSSQ